MLTRCRLSVTLIAVVLTFVTLSCGARDWASGTLPDLPDPGPDSVIVDTTGVVHMYNSSSDWHCWGNLIQGWGFEYVAEPGIVSLDMATEEDEIHAAYISSGTVYHAWRSPGTAWKRTMIEAFRPGSVERVEIERAPDGSLWLAVLYNDHFYLYEHTDQGWNDYVVETMPAQFKDQSLWRFEVDWENRLHLVRQISPIGFYHLIGNPGQWDSAIINNIEELPGDTREFFITGMEMRKDNTPIIHVAGEAHNGKTDTYFAGAVFNNDGDWEAGVSWPNFYGKTAYDHARDRIHCADVQGDDASRYWSVALSDDSRESYTPSELLLAEGICCMTIGKLDLPHIVAWDGGRYVYHRPPADIYVDVDAQYLQAESIVYFGYNVTNWKWERPARLGFVMEIAGAYYWWPNWTAHATLTDMSFDTGQTWDHLLFVPGPDGTYGVDVTFYTALLDPVDDVLLNSASWDVLTVTY